MRPGDRVTFIGASRPEFVEVLYAAAKARAIFIAVNKRLAAREVLDILADAEPRMLIVGRPAAALVADVGSRGFDCRVLVTDAALSAAELLSWTRDRLAHFKCPAGVSFAPCWPAPPPASSRSRPSRKA